MVEDEEILSPLNHKEKLLRKTRTEQLLRIADYSTRRTKTVQEISKGEISFRDYLEHPDHYGYLPMLKVSEFVGGVLQIPTNEARKVCWQYSITFDELKIGKLAKKEKKKLYEMLRKAIDD